MSIEQNAVCYACMQDIRVTASASDDGTRITLFLHPHKCKPSDLRREAADRGEEYVGPLTKDEMRKGERDNWNRIADYWRDLALSQAAED